LYSLRPAAARRLKIDSLLSPIGTARTAASTAQVPKKNQQNLFTRIRRLVSFARSRAMAVQECSRVLQCMSLLVPSESTISLDPKPIAVKDWRKLLQTASGDDKAMLLVMLNCGMYLAEAVALRWKDFKEYVLIGHRANTDRVVRLATLWPATRAALAALPRRGEFMFVAAHGGPLGVKGAEKRWRALRKASGVTGVTSSQIRDGAATAAAEAGVEPTAINLLLGHRSGINDHYVKRRPRLVAPACAAVEKAYFG
jgi:integrase